MANHHPGHRPPQGGVRRSIQARAYGKPRLSVHRSSKQIYAVIDDAKGATLVAASSLEKDQRSALKTGANVDTAKAISQADRRARRCRRASRRIVFDRGSYNYHGRVKRLPMARVARTGLLNSTSTPL